jgi:hypothetical protein
MDLVFFWLLRFAGVFSLILGLLYLGRRRGDRLILAWFAALGVRHARAALRSAAI